MEEAKASWNTQYVSKEGFECQLTLREDEGGEESAEQKLAKRASVVMFSLVNSGCTPIRRYTTASNGEEQPADDDTVYFDADGVRRCNKKVVGNKICGTPIEGVRQGQYGPYWSCPNYKSHVKKQSSG